MKKLLFIFLSILLFTSCSTSKTYNRGVFQKRKYTKGIYINKKSNISKKNSKIEIIEAMVKPENLTEIAIDNTPENTLKIVGDSVKIILKNGEVYNGIKTEETNDGIMLLLKNGRSIFLLKSDIADMKFITNKKTNKTNYQPKYGELTFEIKGNEQLFGTLAKITKTHYQINTSSGEKVYIQKQRVKSIYQANNNYRETLHNDSSASLILFWTGILTAIFGIGILLLLFGGVLSNRGFRKTERAPERYDYKRAKRIKTLYTIAGEVLLAFFLGILFLLATLLL